MIELIFVIVILGILAAIAIPRLAATRDDAEVSKAATNLSTVLSDIGAYYTSQTDFAANISDMTNVAVDGTGTASVGLKAAGKTCLTLSLTTQNAANNQPAYMTVASGSDASQNICQKVLANPSVKKIMETTVTYVDASGVTKNISSANAISGIGVVF